MCNPPFFSTIEESAQNPHTAYGGTQAEMVYPGGDVAFVLQMIEDSTVLQGAIHWYTALLGKKASLKEVWLLIYNLTVVEGPLYPWCGFPMEYYAIGNGWIPN